MKNDGGLAFPELKGYFISSGESSQEKIDCNPVMSLRDYFAAKAMSGLVHSARKHELPLFDEKRVSTVAYEIADAMLVAREEKKG